MGVPLGKSGGPGSNPSLGTVTTRRTYGRTSLTGFDGDAVACSSRLSARRGSSTRVRQISNGSQPDGFSVGSVDREMAGTGKFFFVAGNVIRSWYTAWIAAQYPHGLCQYRDRSHNPNRSCKLCRGVSFLARLISRARRLSFPELAAASRPCRRATRPGAERHRA
jgi:hypothetical protein